MFFRLHPHGRNPVAQLLRGAEGGGPVAALQQHGELLASEPARDRGFAGYFLGDPANRLVADVVAVHVVDALEMVDVHHDGGQAIERMTALADLLRAFEKRAAIEHAGERIGQCQPQQFLLHVGEALGRAQSRVELLGHRRFPDEVVGTAVERFDQLVLVAVARHQDDVDRGFPAQLDPRHFRHRQQLVAGDQGADGKIGPDAFQRFAGGDERAHLVIARREQARDEFQHGAAWVDDDDTHERSAHEIGPNAGRPALGRLRTLAARRSSGVNAGRNVVGIFKRCR